MAEEIFDKNLLILWIFLWFMSIYFTLIYAIDCTLMSIELQFINHIEWLSKANNIFQSVLSCSTPCLCSIWFCKHFPLYAIASINRLTFQINLTKLPIIGINLIVSIEIWSVLATIIHTHFDWFNTKWYTNVYTVSCIHSAFQFSYFFLL